MEQIFVDLANICLTAIQPSPLRFNELVIALATLQKYTGSHEVQRARLWNKNETIGLIKLVFNLGSHMEECMFLSYLYNITNLS